MNSQLGMFEIFLIKTSIYDTLIQVWHGMAEDRKEVDYIDTPSSKYHEDKIKIDQYEKT